MCPVCSDPWENIDPPRAFDAIGGGGMGGRRGKIDGSGPRGNGSGQHLSARGDVSPSFLFYFSFLFLFQIKFEFGFEIHTHTFEMLK
jgi:hypothetical protein